MWIYYDREGRPISASEWSRLRIEGGVEYIRVRSDMIGKYNVSTVWLGLDHNFSSYGPPHIFETMVFGLSEGEMCRRYATEEEAIAGHEETLYVIKVLEETALSLSQEGEVDDGSV